MEPWVLGPRLDLEEMIVAPVSDTLTIEMGQMTQGGFDNMTKKRAIAFAANKNEGAPLKEAPPWCLPHRQNKRKERMKSAAQYQRELAPCFLLLSEMLYKT